METVMTTDGNEKIGKRLFDDNDPEGSCVVNDDFSLSFVDSEATLNLLGEIARVRGLILEARDVRTRLEKKHVAMRLDAAGIRAKLAKASDQYVMRVGYGEDEKALLTRMKRVDRHVKRLEEQKLAVDNKLDACLVEVESIAQCIEQNVQQLRQLEESVTALEQKRQSSQFTPKQDPRGITIPTNHNPVYARVTRFADSRRDHAADQRGSAFFNAIKDRIDVPATVDALPLTHPQYNFPVFDYANGEGTSKCVVPLGRVPNGFRFCNGSGDIKDMLGDWAFYRGAALAAVDYLLGETEFVNAWERKCTQHYHECNLAGAGRTNNRQDMWSNWAHLADFSPDNFADRFGYSYVCASYCHVEELGLRYLFEDFMLRDSTTGRFDSFSNQPLNGQLSNFERSPENVELWRVLSMVHEIKLRALGVVFTRCDDRLFVGIQCSVYPKNKFVRAGRVRDRHLSRIMATQSSFWPWRPDGFPPISTGPKEIVCYRIPDDQPSVDVSDLIEMIGAVPPVQRSFGLPVARDVIYTLREFGYPPLSRLAKDELIYSLDSPR